MTALVATAVAAPARVLPGSRLTLVSRHVKVSGFQRSPPCSRTTAHFRKHCTLGRSRPRPTLAPVQASASSIDQLPGALDSSSVVSVNRKMGEGSFGQVFEGTMVIGGQEQRVVMKRSKPRVARSLEMGEIEIILNQAVKKRASGACADYIGHMQVSGEQAKPRVGLSEGLWLVWNYQGFKTLDSYLRQRDFLKRLSYDMQVEEHSVIPTVMQQTFDCLQRLHAAKIVHRDVKPMNLLFCEEDRRFRLIDLGACADLTTGTNFDPEESMFDPVYCAPEQYIMPVDSMHIGKLSGPMRAMACAAAWNQHRPDRFDMYSAGMVLMQLSLPKLRMQSTLKAFASAVQNYKHDPQLWALRQGLTTRETGLLDSGSHAGWELAKALLRERIIDKNRASISGNKMMRPSARDALGYRFFSEANVPLEFAAHAEDSFDFSDDVLASSGGGGSTSRGTWMQRLMGSFSGSRADSSLEEEEDVVVSEPRG
eukprot:CAMPEP_0177767836 /NCGR_PEP_ID=MMETSP0491_2-20121128/9362_1 /TAXON_ID=63592 /ORGANISM="Tetraselmis chuii, Strain PLY429" /LENGTH=480 /DNA_ID=CAMNT_0019284527 /DNA_START=570 /DNA_END=2012 /DNA_ORIENTATION=+